MDSRGPRLLRANADTGSLEKPQRKGAGTDPHGNRRSGHQSSGHDAHGLAGQKAQLRQAPPQIGGWRRIGAATDTTRARIPGLVRQPDVGRGGRPQGRFYVQHECDSI